MNGTRPRPPTPEELETLGSYALNMMATLLLGGWHFGRVGNVYPQWRGNRYDGSRYIWATGPTLYGVIERAKMTDLDEEKRLARAGLI